MNKIVCYALFIVTMLIGSTSLINAEESDRFQYTTVIVERNDTLWSIAAKHCTNSQDIREVIYSIKQENGLDHTVQIYPGQTLRIPTLKKSALRWVSIWNNP